MASSSIELKSNDGIKLLAPSFGFFVDEMDASVGESYTDNQFNRMLKRERVSIDTKLTWSFVRFSPIQGSWV